MEQHLHKVSAIITSWATNIRTETFSIITYRVTNIFILFSAVIKCTVMFFVIKIRNTPIIVVALSALLCAVWGEGALLVTDAPLFIGATDHTSCCIIALYWQTGECVIMRVSVIKISWWEGMGCWGINIKLLPNFNFGVIFQVLDVQVVHGRALVPLNCEWDGYI